MATTAQPFCRRLKPHPKLKLVRHPQKLIQLNVLFERIIDRDLTGIKRFKPQGFRGIFKAHEYHTGNTVLHLAAYKNDLELIQYFLDEDANINAGNRQVRDCPRMKSLVGGGTAKDDRCSNN